MRCTSRRVAPFDHTVRAADSRGGSDGQVHDLETAEAAAQHAIRQQRKMLELLGESAANGREAQARLRRMRAAAAQAAAKVREVSECDILATRMHRCLPGAAGRAQYTEFGGAASGSCAVPDQ